MCRRRSPCRRLAAASVEAKIEMQSVLRFPHGKREGSAGRRWSCQESCEKGPSDVRAGGSVLLVPTTAIGTAGFWMRRLQLFAKNAVRSRRAEKGCWETSRAAVWSTRSEMTGRTLTKQEARAIIHELDPESVARCVWRATAGADAGEDNAAAVLDLTGGTVRIITWRAGDAALIPCTCVVLAWATDLARERTWRLLSGTSWLAPSIEVVEEGVARRAAREGLCWPSIEEQLRRAHAMSAA